MKVCTGRRAISPLLATLILIAITIVGGVVVYEIFTRVVAVQGSSAQISVQSAAISMTIASGSGTGIFSISFQNSGTTPMTSCTITLTPSSGSAVNLPALASWSQEPCSATLDPGQTTSGVVTCAAPSCGPLTVNEVYSYVVVGQFTDGSSFAASGSVTATSS